MVQKKEQEVPVDGKTPKTLYFIGEGGGFHQAFFRFLAAVRSTPPKNGKNAKFGVTTPDGVTTQIIG